MRRSLTVLILALWMAGPAVAETARFRGVGPTRGRIPVVLQVDRSTYGIGERMGIRAAAGCDGYLLLYYVDATGHASIVTPSPFSIDNHLTAGQWLSVTDNAHGRLQQLGPAGSELLQAIVTRDPIDLSTLLSLLEAEPGGTYAVRDPAGFVAAVEKLLAARIQGNPGAPAPQMQPLPADAAGAWAHPVSSESAPEAPGGDSAGFAYGFATVSYRVAASTPGPITASATVASATGARIALSNGATLRLEGGAMPHDGKITFTKLDTSAVAPEDSFALYQVDGVDGPLAIPATLTLPFGSVPADYVHPDVTVKGFDPQRGFVPVPFTVDLASHTVTAQFSHFSPAEVTWGGSYKALGAELIGQGGEALPVPYYAQLDIPWCFAATSQMLLKYYGFDVAIWEIARHFRLTTDHGASVGALDDGQYRTLFEKYGLALDGGSSKHWRRVDSLNGYLMQQIKKNRPVLVALRYGRHAVVVTGYDREGIWINDPGGFAVAWGTGLSDEQVGSLSGHLAHVKLTWDQWEKAVRGGDYWGLSLATPSTLLDPVKDPVAFTLAVTNGTPHDDRQTVTIASPGERDAKTFQANQDFRFYHLDPDQGVDYLNFVWDGTQADGFKFVAQPRGPSLLPTNSDILQGMRLTVSNGDPNKAARIQVKAAIDQRDLVASPPMTLEPGATNQPVDLWLGADSLKLEKLDQPFAPGDHELKIYLYANDQVVDHIFLHLPLAPAQVKNVKATVSGSQVQVTWDPNLEVTKGVASLLYSVYVDGGELGSTHDTTFTGTLPPSAHPDIRVVARTSENGLTGFLSEKAVVQMAAQPPAAADGSGPIPTITVSPTTAKVGDIITVKTTPPTGYNKNYGLGIPNSWIYVDSGPAGDRYQTTRAGELTVGVYGHGVGKVQEIKVTVTEK